MCIVSVASGAQYSKIERGNAYTAGIIKKASIKEVGFYLGLKDIIDIVVGGDY